MYLCINLSEKDDIHLVLFDSETSREFHVAGANKDLLAAIDDFLKQEEKKSRDFRGIAVVVGVGGFTSTRLAVTVANGFGYALGIPLLAIGKEKLEDLISVIPDIEVQRPGVYISATYSGEPSITKKKAS